MQLTYLLVQLCRLTYEGNSSTATLGRILVLVVRQISVVDVKCTATFPLHVGYSKQGKNTHAKPATFLRGRTASSAKMVDTFQAAGGELLSINFDAWALQEKCTRRYRRLWILGRCMLRTSQVTEEDCQSATLS